MMRLYVVVGFILLFSAVFAMPPALLAQGSSPTISLIASDRTPAVGGTVTVTWNVSGADSVAVRRDGVQISTDHQGEWQETPDSKGVISWEVSATNREGSSRKELDIEVITFGDGKDFVTSGPEGEWVLQMIISVIPGLVFIVGSVWLTKNITPGPFIAAGIIAPVVAFLLAALGLGNYWLATATLILLVLSILGWVQLEKG